MIPSLDNGTPTEDIYLAFLGALEESGFEGEISVDAAHRLVSATDNSVYQVLPQAVCYPKHHNDVVCFAVLLGEAKFRDVQVCPRGGGTGTNGQSLTDGLVIDLSRHMNGILELNLEAGWVQVQPGVVLDQLNDYLSEHGVFFAPNLSPSSRATLGGMISTDAAGKGSRIYGKTSEHVLSLQTVLVGGDVMTTAEMGDDDFDEVVAQEGQIGCLHRVVNEIVTEKSDVIESVFPRLRRFMTGYNLAGVRKDGQFNLNAILTGSEGTLGILTEARLRLTPKPMATATLMLVYEQFAYALADAQWIVEHNPSAIETVDDKIVSLAKGDAIYHRISHFMPDESTKVGAVNLVEFEGIDESAVQASVTTLLNEVANRRTTVGHHVAENAEQASALWALRKKGVGLLGNLKGRRKPVAFVEDTVVDPRRLPEYIAAFRAILDEEGMTYGMFGHIDVGCLHVRPALDLKDPEDEARLRRISDKVCALVQEFGGVIWGEHGKGFRSEYSPRFFGPLYPELQRIKAEFDPHNQLNPGKLSTPLGSDAQLVSIDAPKRGHFDRQITPAALQMFHVAVDCNGNGACFDYHPDHVMCPSSKVTRDRIHSPKGRAALMREWLRQLSRSGFEPTNDSPTPWWFLPITGLRKLWNGLQRKQDFSHQVYEAMDGCLSCKACATQCPIEVDIPELKSRFLSLYFGRYFRPLAHHLIRGLERSAFWGSKMPSLVNAIVRLGIVRWALERVAGISDPPLFSMPGLMARPVIRALPHFSPKTIAAMSPEEKARSVILVQDAFTSFFDADTVEATVIVLQKLGFQPFLAPFFENGKALHVKGFMHAFRARARRNTDRLRRLSTLGVDLVGIEPAVVLTYREEYRDALSMTQETQGFKVHLLQEWLAGRRDVLTQHARPLGGHPHALYGHCTEKTSAPQAGAQWRNVFQALGLELEERALGCCGMCGVFGHETRHVAESKALFEMSWARRLETEVSQERVVATGYSCRSQTERTGGQKVDHPVVALARILR